MTIEPSKAFLDVYAILETTRNVPRDKALKFREELRHLLRALEDMHDFPYSFQTKAEKGDSAAPHGLRKGDLVDREHHNRG